MFTQLHKYVDHYLLNNIHRLVGQILVWYCFK